MRPVLFLYLVLSPLFGAGVYLPVPGVGTCAVEAMTSATPIHVTVTSAAACGLANDMVIGVWGARGLPESWSNPEAAKHLARTVKNLSGNQFDLYDVDTTPAAVARTTGTYVAGGIIWQVSLKAMPSGKILDYNGTGGSIETALRDTSGSGRKNAANIRYTLLQDFVSPTYVTTLGSYPGRAQWRGLAGSGTFNSAVLCDVSNGADTAACTAALYDLQHPDQLTAGVAANPLVGAGGHTDSSVQHYGGAIGGFGFARAANIMADYGFDAGMKTAFANWVCAGYSWAVGGCDLLGTSPTMPNFKLGYSGASNDLTHGTISLSGTVVAGESVITGIGTAFTTDLAVGDWIYMPHPKQSTFAKFYQISTLTSATSAKVWNPLAESSGAQNYAAQEGWASGKAGWYWQLCHQQYNDFCGLGSDYPYADTYAGAPFGGTPFFGGYGGLADSNLVMSQSHSKLAMGMVLCQWGDLRGCWIASMMSMRFYHHHYKYYLPRNSGANVHTSLGYNRGWVRGAIDEALGYFLQNSFTSPYTYLSTTWRDWSAADGTRTWFTPGVPGNEWSAWVEGPEYDINTSQLPGAGLYLQALFPSLTSSKYGRYWLDQRGHASGAWNDNGSIHIGGSYILVDPAMTSTAPPTSWVMNTTERAACTAIWSNCDAESGSFGAFSRTGWTAADTVIVMEAVAPDCTDHCNAGPGQVNTYRNGYRIWGGGNGAGTANIQRSYISIGGDSNTGSYPDNYITPANSSLLGDGSSTYLAARNNKTAWYKAGAAATNVATSVFHFKNGRNLIMQRDEGYTSTGKAMVGYYYLPLLCGTPASSTCHSVVRAALTFTNQLASVAGALGKAVGLSGQVLMTTENASDTDLSVTGYSGAGRYAICPSANGTSCDATNTSIDIATVVLPTGGSGALSTFVGTRESTFAVMEYRDASLPAVAVGAHAGTTINSAAFTGGWTGNAQLIALGLAANTYEVSVGGAPVSGCEALVVTTLGGSLECPAVQPGAITIDAASGGPANTRGIAGQVRITGGTAVK